MMGPAHAVTGAVLGTVACWGLSCDPAHIALGALTVSAAALLPDADHPQGTIARTAGPLSYVATTAISALTGGHRGAMHWAIGIAGITGLAWAAGMSHSPGIRQATWIVLAVLFAAALHALPLHRGRHVRFSKEIKIPWRLVCAVLALPLAWAAVLYEPRALWWMIAAGMTLHVAEDLTTPDGRYLARRVLWPFVIHHRKPGSHPLIPDGTAHPGMQPNGPSHLPPRAPDTTSKRIARHPVRPRRRIPDDPRWDEDDEYNDDPYAED